MKRSFPVISVVAIVASVLATASCSSGGSSKSSAGLSKTSPKNPSSSIETTTATAPPPRASAVVHLIGPISLPKGRQGELSVIEVGAPEVEPPSDHLTVFPVVVRNNTSRTLYNISAHAVARRDRAVVNTGDSNGFAPAAVHPGEWAYGFVLFAPAVPAGSTLHVTATATAAPSTVGQHVDLKIETVNRTPGDSLDGRLSNPSATSVSGTIRVWLICFAGTRPESVLVFDDLALGAGSLSPGATVAFSADLSSLNLPSGACDSSYAISAQA